MGDIKSWVIVWWQVVASAVGLLGTGCIIHIRAFNYLRNLSESKVAKSDFDKEISNVYVNFNDIKRRIEKMENSLFIISGQNGQIIAQLAALKESSEQGDKHLREIMRIIPKSAYIGDKGD